MVPLPQDTPSFVSLQVAEARRFYLDLNPPAATNLAVVCGGWEQCRPDYGIGRRMMPYFGLEFVADGVGMLHLAGQEYPLHRGIAFTYGPGIVHEISTDPERPLSKYFVDFTGVAAAHFLHECGLKPVDYLEAGDPLRIMTAFDRLIDAGSDHGPNYGRITQLQLELLLLQLTGVRIPPHDRGQSYQTFLRCRDHIDAQFLRLQTAEETAAACHLDPAYLARLFAKYANEPPYRYLLRRKMTYAAGLLDSGRLIVREAAAALGMDPFHFSRVFKRVLGVSPSDFARRREG